MPPGRRRPLRILALPAFRKRAANPALALLAEAVRRQGVQVEDWTPWRALGRADLWHLHFPEVFVNTPRLVRAVAGSLLFAGLLLLARRRGIRILWTVHDLGSHDRFNPRLEELFWRFLTVRVDAFVGFAATALPLARERFPALRSRSGFVSDLGGFDDAYPAPPPRGEARRRLGLADAATVLLNFGLIRAYKNLPQLLAAVRALDDPGIVTVIAGRPFEPGVERELRAAAATVPGSRLHLRWIPPAEVSLLFAACDLVVLPYRQILNSGTARLAMTLRRPVLLPDIGLMRTQQERFGPAWVRLYTGALTAADLAEAIVWARDTSRPAVPDGGGLDWEGRGAEACAIYREVLGLTSDR